MYVHVLVQHIVAARAIFLYIVLCTTTVLVRCTARVQQQVALAVEWCARLVYLVALLLCEYIVHRTSMYDVHTVVVALHTQCKVNRIALRTSYST